MPVPRREGTGGGHALHETLHADRIILGLDGIEQEMRILPPGRARKAPQPRRRQRQMPERGQRLVVAADDANAFAAPASVGLERSGQAYVVQRRFEIGFGRDFPDRRNLDAQSARLLQEGAARKQHAVTGKPPDGPRDEIGETLLLVGQRHQMANRAVVARDHQIWSRGFQRASQSGNRLQRSIGMEFRKRFAFAHRMTPRRQRLDRGAAGRERARQPRGRGP